MRSRLRVDMVVMAAAVVIGALLRFPGTRWGLPERLHPDEFVIVTGALDLIHRHSFEPSLYFRPDHVEIQLSSIAYTIYSHLVLHSPVEAAYDQHPGHFLLISRCITVLFGLAMIVLAYLIGRRFNPTIGAIAAVLFAIFPPFVENSQYATPDVPMSAMFMVVILACMVYVEKPGYPSLLVASAATSVGIAIKYPAAVATVMIAIIVIVAGARDRKILRILRHGVVSAVAVVFFLFLISPVLFTNVRAVVASVKAESRPTHPGADGLSWFGNMRFYLDNFMVFGGVVVTILCLVGIVAAVRGRFVQSIPLALGAILWVLLSSLPLHWPRWGVPMYLTPVLFSSIGAYYAFTYLRARNVLRRWFMPAVSVVATVVVVNMLVNSVPVLARGFTTDNRLEARSVLAERGITDRNTVFEGYTPMLPGGPKDLFNEMVVKDGVLAPRLASKKYVVISDCMYGRYIDDPKAVQQRAFYKRLRRDLPRIYHVNPVRIWTSTSIEPLNLFRSRTTVSGYLSGGRGGCELSVFRAGT